MIRTQSEVNAADTIRLHDDGWKDRYYMQKMELDRRYHPEEFNKYCTEWLWMCIYANMRPRGADTLRCRLFSLCAFFISDFSSHNLFYSLCTTALSIHPTHTNPHPSPSDWPRRTPRVCAGSTTTTTMAVSRGPGSTRTITRRSPPIWSTWISTTSSSSCRNRSHHWDN